MRVPCHKGILLFGGTILGVPYFLSYKRPEDLPATISSVRVCVCVHVCRYTLLKLARVLCCPNLKLFSYRTLASFHVLRFRF